MIELGQTMPPVVAIMMVKDELDVIARVLRHLAGEVDHIVVADNASGDGTRDLLADLAVQLPITVLDDPDPAYYQGAKMSRLAALAGDAGAKWILPVDADELWSADDGRVRDVLVDSSGIQVLAVPLFDHFCTHLDPDPGAQPDPFLRLGWRKLKPAALTKVTFRYAPGVVIHQGNHGVTLPGEDGEEALLPRVLSSNLRIDHFPIRTAQQMITKARNGAAAYAHTDLPPGMGQHWREWGALIDKVGEAQFLADVWERYYHLAAPVEEGMIYDPAPYRRHSITRAPGA